MFELTGKYSRAVVYSNTPEEKAIAQIINLCNQPFSENSHVRIMPDYHFGAGCTVGFTAKLGDKVIPNLVGVDIGCGMHVTGFTMEGLDFERLDNTIRNNIPAGKTSHAQSLSTFNPIRELICYDGLKHQDVFERQIGTLGGGNHFIEVDVDDNGTYYLVIHSGSRNLGKQVAEYWQGKAVEYCKGKGDINVEKLKLIEQLKKENKRGDISKALSKLEKEFANAQPKYPRELCFLEGELKDAYLHDMRICQQYAFLNREAMTKTIIWDAFNATFNEVMSFQTIHNYINFKDGIIRKGAVSANKGEPLIIPINMRDGSLLCFGKGNEGWNNSAPHGAGRLSSRHDAKRSLTLDAFKKTMEGIYSTTVNESTLDESPDAYKPMKEIVNSIQDTVHIEHIIRPLYNFKAGE